MAGFRFVICMLLVVPLSGSDVVPADYDSHGEWIYFSLADVINVAIFGLRVTLFRDCMLRTPQHQGHTSHETMLEKLFKLPAKHISGICYYCPNLLLFKTITFCTLCLYDITQYQHHQ